MKNFILSCIKLIEPKLNFKIATNVKTDSLGTPGYGEWTFVPADITPQSVVYSFGVGENASWELALAQKYGVTIDAFDPTPKSIAWVGTQHMGPLFRFHPYGLAAYDGDALFAPPFNDKNVSYRMVSSSAEGSVRLPVKKLTTIMDSLGHAHVDILKMDIEGTEYAVINDMISSKIFPTQILVEFHHRKSMFGAYKTHWAIRTLQKARYKIFHISGTGEEYAFIR